MSFSVFLPIFVSIFFGGETREREFMDSVFVDAVLKSAADCRELEWRYDEYEE
jgi:hypothetical protein